MLALPAGCAFHPRCPFAFEKCLEIIPIDLPHDRDQLVACWLYEAKLRDDCCVWAQQVLPDPWRAPIHDLAEGSRRRRLENTERAGRRARWRERLRQEHRWSLPNPTPQSDGRGDPL